MSWYFKLPSYASRLHTWIVFNIPLAIDTLRLRMCVVSYPYTMFWRGLQLIILHLDQHCFLFNTRETHWKFYRKRDNTIPDFFLLQYTFFTYFVSPIFFFLLFCCCSSNVSDTFLLSKWHASYFYINHYIMKA